MQESIQMRVTQVLERSRLSTPLTITFKTKTIWYASGYWLLQTFILACIYSGTIWFLFLFNLFTVGAAWDKITTINHYEKLQNQTQSQNSDIEMNLSDSEQFSRRSDISLENSEFQQPLNLFGSTLEKYAEKDNSIIGDTENPIIE